MKPKDHTEDCECPACVALFPQGVPPNDAPADPPFLPPPTATERRDDLPQESRPFGPPGWLEAVRRTIKADDLKPGKIIHFSDGFTRAATPADSQWPPLVGNALTRYQKERALLAAVTVWGQRSDDYRDAMIHDDPGCAHYQEVRLALREAIAAVDCCWRDLQAVGGPLP